MERASRMKVKRDRVYIFAMYIAFLIGALQFGMSAEIDRLSISTPYFLSAIYVLVIFALAANITKPLIELFVFAFFAGLLMEIIGVHTGLLFGNYHYTSLLGPAIMGVPIIIAFNWAFLIAGGILISDVLFKNRILQIASAVLLIVIFDVIMEPVAVKLHYWEWANNSIPLYNYISWAFVSLICVGYRHYRGLKINGMIFIHYYVAQTLFFGFLRFLV